MWSYRPNPKMPNVDIIEELKAFHKELHGPQRRVSIPDPRKSNQIQRICQWSSKSLRILPTKMQMFIWCTCLLTNMRMQISMMQMCHTPNPRCNRPETNIHLCLWSLDLLVTYLKIGMTSPVQGGCLPIKYITRKQWYLTHHAHNQYL